MVGFFVKLKKDGTSRGNSPYLGELSASVGAFPVYFPGVPSNIMRVTCGKSWAGHGEFAGTDLRGRKPNG